MAKRNGSYLSSFNGFVFATLLFEEGRASSVEHLLTDTFYMYKYFKKESWAYDTVHCHKPNSLFY